MTKSIVISERDNIAAVMENNRVAEFFIHRGNMLLGDVYLASVENILPSIDAAFVNLGGDKMGFLHASDVPGKGPLKDRLTPKQQLMVQIIKEPTGHKGPRITTAVSLPGRFLVFMPDEKGISVSRKITSIKERSRLKSIVNLLKPPGVGVIIRTEAENQSESEIQEDLELLLEKWNNIVTTADTVAPPSLLYRDQDLLYRVIREACTEEVKEIILDTPFALHRTNQLLQSWNMGQDINVSVHKGTDSILAAKGIEREIRSALQTKVNLPSGGYLYIQSTEALTVIDINSGKFTSSATQGETIRKTNLEAVTEIARQLKLRNIGGMIIIDFIDMENRVDKLAILEELEIVLEPDKSKPQIGQLSDLGLVELTRHRQGQSLAEIFTKKCPACSGTGAIIEEFNFAAPPVEADVKLHSQRLKMPQQNFKNKMQQQNANKPQPAATTQQQQQNVEQKQPMNQHHQKPQHNMNAQNQQRRINTTPSMAATKQQQQHQHKPQQQVENPIELTEDALKQVIGEKAYLSNISKVVRFSAVPPKVARERMPGHYIMDVFSIMQEIEAAENAATPTAAKEEKPKQTSEPIQPVIEEKEIQEIQEIKIQPSEEIVEIKETTEKEEEKVEIKEEVVVQENPESVETEPSESTEKPKRGRRPKTTKETDTTKKPARGRKPAAKKE